MIDEDEVQIGTSLVDPLLQLDDLQDISDTEDEEQNDQIKCSVSFNVDTQEAPTQIQLIDDDSPELGIDIFDMI